MMSDYGSNKKADKFKYMPIVYLNGEFTPLSEARVSVLDRGFTFGDGVYEVIPVFAGNIFRLDEHLDRLDGSMSCLDIELGQTREELKNILTELVRKNSASGDQQIYLQVTRGVTERDHHYSGDIEPTFFAMCKPMVEKDTSAGINAITHEDIRWTYCHIKSTALLASVLLKKIARDADGSQEAILIRSGQLTEGASSNVFIVKDGVVMTPRKDNNILPGITRDLLVELLRDSGQDCLETDISEEQLRQADEIWITSSTNGVVAVINLDGKVIGEGRPGRCWKQARELYDSFRSKGRRVIRQEDRVA